MDLKINSAGSFLFNYLPSNIRSQMFSVGRSKNRIVLRLACCVSSQTIIFSSQEFAAN